MKYQYRFRIGTGKNIEVPKCREAPQYGNMVVFERELDHVWFNADSEEEAFEIAYHYTYKFYPGCKFRYCGWITNNQGRLSGWTYSST